MEEADKEKVLEELSFSKNEAKVYLALLDLGSTTATKISDLSKIHRTTVYDCLDGLVKKGFVSYISKGDVKYFKSCNPENLMGIIKQKEENLKAIIPQLELSERLAESKDKAHIYEGLQGIKTTLRDAITTFKEGDEILVFGVPEKAHRLLGSFVDWFHKKRFEKKITMYHIYNEDARERINYLNSLPYTKAGYLPKEYDSPTATRIYADKVCFVVWSEPQLAILIESKRMADAYRRYFKLLWSLAKK